MREYSFRNSANYIRNFGRRMALMGEGYHSPKPAKVAESRPKRLFNKNTGLCKVVKDDV